MELPYSLMVNVRSKDPTAQKQRVIVNIARVKNFFLHKIIIGNDVKDTQHMTYFSARANTFNISMQRTGNKKKDRCKLF